MFLSFRYLLIRDLQRLADQGQPSLRVRKQARSLPLTYKPTNPPTGLTPLFLSLSSRHSPCLKASGAGAAQSPSDSPTPSCLPRPALPFRGNPNRGTARLPFLPPDRPDVAPGPPSVGKSTKSSCRGTDLSTSSLGHLRRRQPMGTREAHTQQFSGLIFPPSLPEPALSSWPFLSSCRVPLILKDDPSQPPEATS